MFGQTWPPFVPAKLGGWPRPFLAQSLALICPVLNAEALAFSLFGEGNGWA